MDAKLEVTLQNSNQQREASKKISKRKTIQGGDKKKETIDGKVCKRKIDEVTSDDQSVKKRRTGNFISDNKFKRLGRQVESFTRTYIQTGMG